MWKTHFASGCLAFISHLIHPPNLGSFRETESSGIISGVPGQGESALPSGSPTQRLPPLDCLRFFDAAARHQSFVRAAREINVTPAAVSYRVRVFEDHLGHSFFDRTGRGIVLNEHGKACLMEVRRILDDIGSLVERYRSDPHVKRLSVVAVEAVAERWLVPLLADFHACRPDISIDLETDLLVDPNRLDYDVWITYAGEAPSAETAHHERLFEETRLPVCSPALLTALGQPSSAKDLLSWPLLYHLGWPSDWAYWFTAQGATPPDLSHASGFRLSGMLVRAALAGMGAAIGGPTWVASELKTGALVPVFDCHVETRTTCCLITTTASRRKPQVQEFREWILRAAVGDRVDEDLT